MKLQKTRLNDLYLDLISFSTSCVLSSWLHKGQLCNLHEDPCDGAANRLLYIQLRRETCPEKLLSTLTSF